MYVIHKSQVKFHLCPQTLLFHLLKQESLWYFTVLSSIKLLTFKNQKHAKEMKSCVWLFLCCLIISWSSLLFSVKMHLAFRVQTTNIKEKPMCSSLKDTYIVEFKQSNYITHAKKLTNKYVIYERKTCIWLLFQILFLTYNAIRRNCVLLPQWAPHSLWMNRTLH